MVFFGLIVYNDRAGDDDNCLFEAYLSNLMFVLVHFVKLMIHIYVFPLAAI